LSFALCIILLLVCVNRKVRRQIKNDITIQPSSDKEMQLSIKIIFRAPLFF